MTITSISTIPSIFPDGIIAAFGHTSFSEENIPPSRIFMHQTHGNTISYVDKNKDHIVSSSDGILTVSDRTSLIVKTADCVPMLFYDAQSGLIGASHQGWKGTLDRLQQKMIEDMVVRGAKRNLIKVAIGPCIGACCYSIYGERKRLFEKAFSIYIDEIFVKNNNDTMLNLLRLNYELLCEAGVKPRNIEYTLACTSCQNKVFNSYNKNKKATSMLSYIRKS